MAEYINLDLERKVLRCLFWKKPLMLKASSRGHLSDDLFSDKSFKLLVKWMKSHFTKTGELMALALLESKIERLRLKGKDDKDIELYKEKLHSICDKFLFKKPTKRDIQNFSVYMEELTALLKARDMQKFNMKLFHALDQSKVEEAESLIQSYHIPAFGDDVDQAEITENFQEREHWVLERKNNPDKYKLIPTGFADLDFLLGGGLGREYGMVAGSSNAGKSFWLQHVACHARRKGLNVVLFTIEMQLLETQNRCDCNLANIDYKFFRNPAENYDEKVHNKWKKKMQAFKKKSGRLEVVSFKENAKMSIIKSKCYELMNEWQEPIDLIVIDYLDDIEPDKEYREFKNWASFGEISWEMHKLAKNFQQIDGSEGVPIWSAIQMRKASKDITKNEGALKGEQKRALDERDVGSSPLPFRHSDVFIGIQTVYENKLSLLHIMKGRFTDKAVSPPQCYHDFAKGKFHSNMAKSKFEEDQEELIKEKEALLNDEEMEIEE